MNLDSLSFTLSQISYLVASLTKKKYSQVIGDLSKVSSIQFICTLQKILPRITKNVIMDMEHPPYLHYPYHTKKETDLPAV